MKILLQQISELDYAVDGTSISHQAIEETQEVLSMSGRPEIPLEVIEFLQHYNGIANVDGCIWGIDANQHTLYDIAAENLISQNPYPETVLLLGENSVTYIAWNKKTKKFTMLDKSTFEELHNFSNYPEAVSYILKILRPE